MAQAGARDLDQRLARARLRDRDVVQGQGVRGAELDGTQAFYVRNKF
jgi:hypothetical protein